MTGLDHSTGRTVSMALFVALGGCQSGAVTLQGETTTGTPTTGAVSTAGTSSTGSTASGTTAGTSSGASTTSGAAACRSSSMTWQSTPFAAQSGTFTATFDATPSSVAEDAVTGLSLGAAAAFSDLAVSLRFNANGTIDALDGATYPATTIAYTAGTTYHFRVAVDVASHTYDAYVTPAGSAEQPLGTGYAFRTSQESVTSLDHWALYEDMGGAHQVCNFAISSAATAATTGGSQTTSGGTTTGGASGNGTTTGVGATGSGSSGSTSGTIGTWGTDAGATFSCTQVSQYGVTWTFSASQTCGQFANGDYWVVGPVTIESIAPDATNSGGRHENGWDVNPLPSNPQGYDSCAGDYNGSQVPALPYLAAPGSSIVKAVSAVPPGPGSSPACLQTAAVLTVVDQPPPDNGATVFRPPYTGSKTVPMTYYSVNDVQWSLLPSLSPNASVTSFAPTLDSIAARLNRVQLDHLNGRTLNVSTYIYNGIPNQEINPIDNQGNYGPDIDLENNDAILRLMLNDPLSAKAPVGIGLIQGGIDRYGMLLNGQFWPAGSGMFEGRKVSIAFAALLLGDTAMQQAVTGPNVLGMTDFFLEDQTIGTGYQGTALYGTGIPGSNACNQPGQTCSSPDFSYYWSWEAQTIGANDGSADPYGYLDGSMNGMQNGDGYQPINSPAYEGTALIAVLMPSLYAVWGHPEFFSYVDRWVMHGIQALPDPCAPLSAGGGPDPHNPGGCILDPNLTAGSTMQHFSCQAGKSCGRWPQYDGNQANSGNPGYQSGFTNAMWADFRNAFSASVYTSWSGVGQGTITSDPAGITCGTNCAASFPVGTVVTLTATPTGSSTFAGWTGACSGTGTCTLTLNAVSSAIPTTSVCSGQPAGETCSPPPTANAIATATFQ